MADDPLAPSALYGDSLSRLPVGQLQPLNAYIASMSSLTSSRVFGSATLRAAQTAHHIIR